MTFPPSSFPSSFLSSSPSSSLFFLCFLSPIFPTERLLALLFLSSRSPLFLFFFLSPPSISFFLYTSYPALALYDYHMTFLLFPFLPLPPFYVIFRFSIFYNWTCFHTPLFLPAFPLPLLFHCYYFPHWTISPPTSPILLTRFVPLYFQHWMTFSHSPCPLSRLLFFSWLPPPQLLPLPLFLHLFLFFSLLFPHLKMYLFRPPKTESFFSKCYSPFKLSCFLTMVSFSSRSFIGNFLYKIISIDLFRF